MEIANNSLSLVKIAPAALVISGDIRTFSPALVFKWSKTRAGKKVPREQIIEEFSRNGRKQGGGKGSRAGEKVRISADIKIKLSKAAAA